MRPGWADQGQRQHDQTAGQPGEQIIEASAGCPQPAQPAAAVPEHGIQRAAGLEAPGQRQRTRARGQDHPQQGTDPHPEQRCEHAIHGIL